MDDFGHVLGVVSEADLLHKVEAAGETAERRIFEGRRRHTTRVKASGTLARDLMSAPAVTAMADTTVAAAARLMDADGVKRLPVVDELGRLIGIVSRADLLRVYLRPDGAIRRDVVNELGYDVDDTLVADVSVGPPYGATSRSPFGGNR
jgi:CBS-domain-containing membrane protein